MIQSNEGIWTRTFEGNVVTVDAKRAKLRLVVETARAVLGDS